MSDSSEQESRTEAATARRLQRAREDGQAPVSRECISLATLAATALALVFLAAPAAERLAGQLAALLHRVAAGPGDSDVAGLLRHAALSALAAAAPFVLAVLVAGAAAVLGQTGFLLHAGPLRPKLSRLNPGAGLKRLFGVEGVAETIRSLAKLAATGSALWLALRPEAAALAAALAWPAALLPGQVLRLTLRAVFAVLLAQAVIALADLAWVRYRHARSLRMTREDVREETREAEGDPRIKARIRQIRQLRARRRMLAAVPTATVIVTNPTHYAVALRYDRARHAAPRVVAKGVDTLAARIRDTAERHGVPVVANPPLARALYRVELDGEIPAEHFRLVAEIIAYVWRLNRRVAV